ncbi:MAG: hypothetical protein RLY97_1591, partial [Pseudomonadota bacterium]
MLQSYSKAAANGEKHLIVIGLSSALAMLSMAIAVALLITLLVLPHSGSVWLTYPAMGFAVLALVLEAFIAVYGRKEFHARAAFLATANEAKWQTDELFAMTEMLQSADSYEDATAVLMATSQ